MSHTRWPNQGGFNARCCGVSGPNRPKLNERCYVAARKGHRIHTQKEVEPVGAHQV